MKKLILGALFIVVSSLAVGAEGENYFCGPNYKPSFKKIVRSGQAYEPIVEQYNCKDFNSWTKSV